MVDSHQVRFAQGSQALLLGLAFLFDAAWAVPALALVMAAALAAGPRWNLFVHLFRIAPIPPGEPEPAAPPRFSQALGVAFLAVATAGLYAASTGSAVWWVLGWGPALAVAVLAAVASTTSF